jgi:glucose/arabinose dehydrogenase
VTRALPLLVMAAAGCGGQDKAPGGPPAPAAEIRLEAVASGLVIPWAVAFAPDGRIFVTERPGRIRVVDEKGLRPEPWAELAVISPEYRSEGGLLGIAVAPDFETSSHVYAVVTVETAGALANRVLRFTDRQGRGADQTVVVDGLPAVHAAPGSERAIHTHVGGALAFGPDGMLYLTTGDATRPELAQDPASLAGKLLRYRPDGSIPADNPLPGSPVFALGLRNPQGLAFSPQTGQPIVTDHGPSELSWEGFGGWFGDELNAVLPGRNYGWPSVAGVGAGARYVDPLVEWSPSIAPAGVAVYSGSLFPWSSHVLVASLRGEQLLRFALERDGGTASGWKAAPQQTLLEGRVGRIRIVAMGPDGHLYVATSNRDGRGKPQADDDRLYRVVR